jgi:serine protease
LNRKILLLSILLIVTCLPVSGQQIIQNEKTFCLSNTLIVKVKNSATLPQLNETLAKHALTHITEIFPSEAVLSKKSAAAILAGIYIVRYNTMENPAALAAEVTRLSGVLWAEPKYVRTVCFNPNDSLFLSGDQDNLLQIGAPQAWERTTGNRNIIIGIVDSGVDWKHPDLAANIYMENGSLIPGSDLGNMDDDPAEDVNPEVTAHGTLVAGIASAVTNNGIGVASIGYNCSILPVKAGTDGFLDSESKPYILKGFEGIKWAADHGARIINCSWGGYGYSSYEQSIIDYALAKGAVVVAAQGNDSSTHDFYPASYKGVLSVGWLKTGVGEKSIHPGANYGEKVMVFAPGSGIYSTTKRPAESAPGIYNTVSGSSVATPHVSGLAGLVWTKFPFYTPRQVLERIRVTSDYIDDYNSDSYKNLLGHGCINASRAVDESFEAISIRADSISFNGNTNREKNFGPGEVISVSASFTNYLAKTDNITITFTTSDSFVTMENNTFNTGPMDSMTTISNESNEFIFRVSGNTPDSHIIHFLLKYSNGSDYNDFQNTNIKIINTCYTHNNNNITLTVTGKGTLGFNDYPNNTTGNGFKYKGSENLMHEGAFMYGTGPARVMNEARIHDRQKTDFINDGYVKKYITSDEFTCSTSFSDLGAGTNALGIKVIQVSRSLTAAPNDNYIFLPFELQNESAQDIKHLYVGYFIDWNMGASDYEADRTYYDTTNNAAIAYNSKNPETLYTAMALISTGNGCGFYAIDNRATSGPVQIGDADGFTDAEKWYALSNGIKQISAGVSDIAYVISGGPYDIPSDQSVWVEFAIGAGPTLQEALQAINAARIRYGNGQYPEEQPLVFKLYQNYPNPFNPMTMINYQLPITSNVEINIYNLLGQKVATLVNQKQPAGNYHIQWDATGYSTGVYYYRLKAGDLQQVKKMILIK